MKFFSELPLVAILRGVLPSEVEDIGEALFSAGFRVIEVPLNSPDALKSIVQLSSRFGDCALIGAGTVLTVQDVEAVADAGGRLVVSPNTNPAVIEATKRLGMLSGPGVATPSEGFTALDAGADFLKLFPAENIPAPIVKAWSAVFPRETLFVAVGGITPDNMDGYFQVGVRGFGLGSSLYRSGLNAETVHSNAKKFVSAWQALA
jgi:2-dehydro-3-deoxyphosphogalactonate aldolase